MCRALCHTCVCKLQAILSLIFWSGRLDNFQLLFQLLAFVSTQIKGVEWPSAALRVVGVILPA